jgi:hypothetical protein
MKVVKVVLYDLLAYSVFPLHIVLVILVETYNFIQVVI